MKKILLVILALMMVTVSLAGCGGSEPQGKNWSIFVYLCGTDLETENGLATLNLEEMLKVDQADSVKLLVQTGGTREWHNSLIQADVLGRYEVADGDIALVDEQPLASMGSADTLGDFLKWGVTNYPADKYMVVIWNHGGGSISGAAFDELHDNDSLDVSELAAGIASAGVQFEIIGFDTCLMATLETAAALSPYGRYLVASQEIEPGSGWDYTAWLQFVSDNPTADGLQVGTAICDSYFIKCGDTIDIATLSVTDLSLVPKLVTAFDNLASELKQIVAEPAKYQPFAQAMSRAESYGGNNANEGYTNMVDLGDLVRKSDIAFSSADTEVLSTLADAVKYQVNGTGRPQASGLSLFVPLSVDADTLNNYATAASVSPNYLRYFESIFKWTIPSGVEVSKASKGKVLNPDDYAVTYHTELSDDGYYMLIVDSGADVIQTVAYNLYFEDDNGETIFFLGSDYDLNYDEETGVYWDNFRNVWPVINGETISMLPLDQGENYISYTVPIMLNGEETNLRMTYDFESHAYSVLGTWDGIDENGMSSKEIRHLVDGDEVVFLFNASDYGSDEVYTIEFGGFTVNGDVVVEEYTLFDGTFFYEYEMTDIFGRVYTSDMAIITSLDGEITIETLAP